MTFVIISEQSATKVNYTSINGTFDSVNVIITDGGWCGASATTVYSETQLIVTFSVHRCDSIDWVALWVSIAVIGITLLVVAITLATVKREKIASVLNEW